MRLELLEAVVAFQMGERILARQHLEAAKQLWDTLQVRRELLLNRLMHLVMGPTFV